MSKNTTLPAYLVLVQQLLETCDRLDLQPLRADTDSTLPENSGWCFLRFGNDSAPAIIVGKGVSKVNVHSHVDYSDLECWIELTKSNGRVIGHIDAATADWDEIVSRLPGASKRAIKRASKAASVKTDMSAFIAKLATLGTAKPAPEPETVTVPEDAFGDDSEDMVDSL